MARKCSVVRDEQPSRVALEYCITQALLYSRGFYTLAITCGGKTFDISLFQRAFHPLRPFLCVIGRPAVEVGIVGFVGDLLRITSFRNAD